MVFPPIRFQIPVFLLFLLFWLVSVFLVKWEIGVPVRTIILFFSVVYIPVIYQAKFNYILFKNFHFLALLAIGIIGFLISSFYTLDLVSSALYTLRLAIQPALILVYTMLCCYYIGLKTVINIFVAVILISGIIATFQYFDVQLAWDIRSKLDAVQSLDRLAIVITENDSVLGVYNDRFRGRGLSYSPIHLGYQVALVWALFYISWKNNNFDIFPYSRTTGFIIIGILFVTIISTGTRSIFFGIILLYILNFIFFTKNKPLIILFIITSVVLIIVGPSIYNSLLNIFDIRVLQLDNSSGFSRVPLAIFGFLLFLDNPFGHGWLIETEVFASKYWYYLHKIRNAEAILQLGLHNHLLRILYVYGIGGLTILVVYMKSIIKYYGLVYLIALSPYYFHSLFHNDGIFLGGNYIWVFMGIIHFDFVSKVFYRKIVDK